MIYLRIDYLDRDLSEDIDYLDRDLSEDLYCLDRGLSDISVRCYERLWLSWDPGKPAKKNGKYSLVYTNRRSVLRAAVGAVSYSPSVVRVQLGR